MRRRLVLATAGVVLLAVAAVAGLLVLDLRQVQRDLEGFQDAARELRDHLADGEVDDADRAQAVLADRADRAAVHTTTARWRLASRLPGAGPTLRTVSDLVGLATATTPVTGQALAAAAATGDEGDGAPLAPIVAGARELARLDLTQLTDARDALARRHGWLPAPLADARGEALAVADEALSALDEATASARVLPGLLGADEPRRYLIAMQNNAELRGTGGLVGFAAVLEVDGRDLELSAVVENGDIRALIPAADPEFERRYGHLRAWQDVRTVNVDPDLPTVAPRLLDLFEAAMGQTADGVVLIDPIGLATILDGGDPLDLPDGFDTEGGPTAPLPTAELPQATLVDAYVRFGGATPERKRFHTVVAEAAFARLADLEPDPTLLRRLAVAAAGRHLQVHVTDPAAAGWLDGLGVSGRLTARPQHDLLAVTANNAAGNKQDVHIRYATDVRVELDHTDGAWTRRATVGVTVDNPLTPTSLPPYIVGSGDEPGDPDPPAVNRTWFTVWADAGTRAVAGRGHGGVPLAVSTGTIDGRRAVDRMLETPPRSTRAFEVVLDGDAAVSEHAGGATYRLTLWRQARGLADDLRLVVTPPAGWRIADAELDAAHSPSFDGSRPGRRPELQHVGDAVVVAGRASTDVHLVVELVPATG